MAIDWDQHVLAPLMGVFGEDVQPTYLPKSGAPSFAVDGVFDRAFTAVTIDESAAGGVAMNTVGPVLGVRLAQFGAAPPQQGDRVTVPSVGITFVVRNVEPDGHGWALLRLNKTTDA